MLTKKWDLLDRIKLSVNNNGSLVGGIDTGNPPKHRCPSCSNDIVAESIDRKFNIRGCNRDTIVPARLGMQTEYHPCPYQR